MRAYSSLAAAMNIDLNEKLLQLGIIKTPSTGKVIYRYKQVVKHTGVVVGTNSNGELVIIHNHPNSDLELTTLEQFTRGKRWFYETSRKHILEADRILSNSIYLLEHNLSYHLLRMNCQHTSSLITTGKKKSNGLRLIMAILLIFPCFFWLLIRLT